MRPVQWEPPIELSATEQMIVKRIRRAKLFIFLREHRHEVFDAAFQEELATLYQDSPRGQPPVAPAPLALATILQAYTGASDDEVIEASLMDRRWQLVLDCLDTEEAPFSKGTLIAFRKRLIEANMDRRLIERTIEVARQAGAFGAGALRAALEAVEGWLETQPESKADPAVQAHLQTAQQIKAQDVEVSKTATATLRKGVAKERRISIEDAQMRHGRKSRSVRVDGYKRHILHDLDTGLVRAVGITPANAPEASVTEAISADLIAQQAHLAELHIDRAYLSSPLVRAREASLVIYCKAWPVRNRTGFAKTAFELDWERQRIRCPNQQEMPFEPGGTVHFPAEVCAVCPLRERCTSSPRGRSVSIHPDEALLGELRQRQLTTAGRARLRERIAVEHTLAHVGFWQGRRARYCGDRKNLFDLRRCAIVHNLHVLARLEAFSHAA